MRIIYVALCSSRYSGVEKKIIEQCIALKNLGVEIYALFVLDGIPDKSLSEISRNNEFIKYVFPSYKVNKWIMRKWKMAVIDKNIRQLSNDRTIVYLRYPGADPHLCKLLETNPKLIFVSEHQSAIVKGIMLKKGYFLRSVSEKLFGRLVRRKIDAFVGVTNEVVAYQRSFVQKRNIPTITIPNGIIVSSVPLRTPPPFDGKNLDLLCVAQVAKWHGLDRLIRGMAEYKGEVNVRLNVVGYGSEIPNLKKLILSLKLDDSVLFHGFKTGKELDEFFDKCHIAVGSLGLHRVGVSEGSILKVREYCARGIPFIYGVPDADFQEGFPYVLRVPSNEEPVDIAQVISFAGRICSDQRHPQFMREYALINLDWSMKMKKLVEFMNEVFENKVRR
ncbi:MAG: glycosyltransferase family 4 protein [Candidatus Methanofastidiosa archaeon]|nr:glycosyltransferase family 4 protein [Candidatus Methanofastidiosa archaeon]